MKWIIDSSNSIKTNIIMQKIKYLSMTGQMIRVLRINNPIISKINIWYMIRSRNICMLTIKIRIYDGSNKSPTIIFFFSPILWCRECNIRLFELCSAILKFMAKFSTSITILLEFIIFLLIKIFVLLRFSNWSFFLNF